VFNVDQNIRPRLFFTSPASHSSSSRLWVARDANKGLWTGGYGWDSTRPTGRAGAPSWTRPARTGFFSGLQLVYQGCTQAFLEVKGGFFNILYYFIHILYILYYSYIYVLFVYIHSYTTHTHTCVYILSYMHIYNIY